MQWLTSGCSRYPSLLLSAGALNERKFLKRIPIKSRFPNILLPLSDKRRFWYCGKRCGMDPTSGHSVPSPLIPQPDPYLCRPFIQTSMSGKHI
ncbi:unnamed protein product [Boreogadus saida]